jgi:hypothetical protein
MNTANNATDNEATSALETEQGSDAHVAGDNPAWLVPFCACGRQLTECDGSRRLCVSRKAGRS